MAKAKLKLVTPATLNRTVTPTRRPNKDLRTREHLTPKEVENLIDAVGGNRWGHRDATMILLAFRHGLRAAELIDLYGSAHFRARVGHDTNQPSRLTLERKHLIIRQLCSNTGKISWKTARGASWHQPL